MAGSFNDMEKIPEKILDLNMACLAASILLNQLKVVQQIIDKSPIAIVLTDLKGKIEYANVKFFELTGYTQSELIGQNPRVLKSGYQSKEFYEQLWKTISSGQIWKGEFCNKKKNGEIFWEQATISPIKNDKHVITHYLALKENITDKVLALDKLYENEKILKSIINLNTNPIFVKDENLNIMMCNKAFASFYGIECEDDLIGKRSEHYNKRSEEDASSYDIDKKILEENSNLVAKEKRTDFAGNEHWFKVHKFCFYNEMNKKKRLLMVATDITDTEINEKVFKESHESFQSFLNCIPNVVFVTDSEGKYVFINKKAIECFNINDDYYGLTTFDIIKDIKYSKKIHESNMEILESGFSREFIEVMPMDDEPQEWATVKIPFYFMGNKYLITMYFIDPHKGLLEIKEELLTGMEKQAFFSMATFISGFTHELRTPVQSMKGGLELIKKRILQNNVDQKRDITLIDLMLSEADDANRKISNIINFGMSSGHYHGEDVYKTIIQDMKTFNLKKSISETIDLIKLNAVYKEEIDKCNIIINGDEDIECMTSHYILRNILINLINNAIKAIVVREKREPHMLKKEIKINFFIDDEKDINIEIEDNGVGIQQELAHKLFSPFYRINRDIPGIGIGLFMSKFWATSAMMDLNLKESQYGKTVFRIIIKNNLLEE